MPFKYKLSRRLAILRLAMVLVASGGVACELARAPVAGPAGVAKVVISPDSTSVSLSDSIDFVAVALTASGDTVDATLTWQAGRGSVTEKNGGNGRRVGHYRPGRGGKDQVIVTDGSGAADTAVVVVVVVASVDVTPVAPSVLVGGKLSLTASPKDSAGQALSGLPVLWSSGAPGIATVAPDGVVTGVAPGSATITAEVDGEEGATIVTVATVPVATVTVTPASTSLNVGASVQLSATTRDSVGATLAGRPVMWASTAVSVATVSATGRVTAVSTGAATIMATSEGKIGTAQVTVTLAPVASVVVTPASPSVQQGQTVQLTATLKDAGGNTLTGRPVTWSNGGSTVASVSTAGLVAGLSAGTATITATSEGRSGSAAVTVTAPPAPGTRVGYYVTPSGTSTGDGTMAKPWNLRTALSGAGGRIHAGDTVWVRGGTYNGSFTSSLAGTAGAHIVVRAYPGERAILDGANDTESTLVVDGRYTVIWGLEIMNSRTDRVSSGLGLRPGGVYVRNCNDVKLVNLIIHDTGHGVYTEYAAQNIELYGWIVFNGGHQNSSRSDGHGIYIKNDNAGYKVVRDNIIFNQFAFGIHGYTESSGALRNLTFEGNVLFNNGEVSNFDNPNLLLGGNRIADNDVVANNMTYFSPGHGSRNFRVGYSTQMNGTGVVRENYVVGGSEVVEVSYWQNLTWTGNTFVGSGNMIRPNDRSAAGQAWSGNVFYRDPNAKAWHFDGTWLTFANWRQATGWGATDQAVNGTPTATKVFVRPNQYEPGRATVVVYNWGRQGSVGADLSGVIPVGHVYEVRNVQRIFDAPVVSGTFTGGTLQLPMTGVTAYAPIGGSPNQPLVTGPDFDVFVVTSRAP